MAELHRAPSHAELERLLTALGQQLEFPPTPPLAQHLPLRLTAAPRRRPWPDLLVARRLAIAVAAVLLALLVVLIAVPGTRTALAGRLGLPGIEIRQVPTSPRRPAIATSLPGPVLTATARAGPAPTALPITPLGTALPSGQRLDLGTQMTLPAAQSRVSFPLLLPAQLGPPDAVFVASAAPGGEVTLVYAPRAGLPVTTETGVGLLLGEFQGRTDQVFISKMAGPGTTIAPVTVAGQPGFWLTGQPHEFLYEDVGGVTHRQTLRLAGNTLIWTRGDLTLRIESALTEDAALKLANSVH